MDSVLLGIHIALGGLGIALGPVVIWWETRQLMRGRWARSELGAAYHLVVLLICVSAVALVMRTRPDLWALIPVAAASYSLVVLGRIPGARRFRGWTHAYVHGVGSSYIAFGHSARCRRAYS